MRSKCRELGLGFDPWQHGTGQVILAKRADGLYAAGIGGVVISIPRQVGKTYLLGAIVFALCLLNPNLTVIWTAHRLRTANETFSSMRSMSRRKKIKPFVEKIILGSGEEEIRFANGSRILFGARERGFGLGFSGVDVLVFDEAQRLSEAAIDDMVPTTNQAPNPLLLFTGTPPRPTDSGEVFTNKRAEALASGRDIGFGATTADLDEAFRAELADEDTAYIEFSADADAKPDDWAQIRRGNPSHPLRTPRASVLRMRKNLTPDSFLREGMGIWDDDAAKSTIPVKVWGNRADRSENPAPHVGRVWLAIDTDPDRARTSIVACGVRVGGRPLVEVTSTEDGAVDNHAGVEWAVLRAKEIHARNPIAAVLVVATAAAGSLIKALQAAKLPVVPVTDQQYKQACGQFYDAAVETGLLEHLAQRVLDDAVKVAIKRPSGDAWVWDRKKATADITPVTGATLALYGWASKAGVKRNAGKGRVVVMS